jgi:amino acid transporter
MSSARCLVILAGGAVQIYLVLERRLHRLAHPWCVFAYFLLRQRQPDLERPYRLPEFMKWVAPVIAIFFAIVWLLGGIFYSNIGNTLTYYLIGIGVLLLYIPRSTTTDAR